MPIYWNAPPNHPNNRHFMANINDMKNPSDEDFHKSLNKTPSEYRAVTQSDLDRNDALRGDHKKVGDMVYFEVKEKENMKKEQFMAQYWGQKVLILTDRFANIPITYVNVQTIGLSGYLSLRSISQLTDVELMHLYKILLPYIVVGQYENLRINRQLHYISIASFSGSACINMDGETSLFDNGYDDDGNQVFFDANVTIDAYQYLISIGILLDETAVSKGWARVKDDK